MPRILPRILLRHHIQVTRVHRRYASALPVAAASPPSEPVDIRQYQREALTAEKPLVFHKTSGSPTTALPALSRWFSPEARGKEGLSSHLASFEEWPFPYELVKSSNSQQDAVASFRDWLLRSGDLKDQMLAGMLQPALSEEKRLFFELFGPLRLLIKALEFNRTQPCQELSMLNLYIAQAPLSDLPPALREDAPIPDFVQQAGKGDIYVSSVWLGTEPTYSPFHRDPNPNLFCQLFSRKIVRLLPPQLGYELFVRVQTQIGQQGSARLRSVEMMDGKEREALHDAVWSSDVALEELQETKVEPGDALLIPKGWWHSVKSIPADGRLNGSVNWWFR